MVSDPDESMGVSAVAPGAGVRVRRRWWVWLLIALGPVLMCAAVPVVGAAVWLGSETSAASRGGRSPVDATYGVLWSLEALSDDDLVGTGRYLAGDVDGMRARLLAMRDQLAGKGVGYYLRISEFVTVMDGVDGAMVTVNVGVAWSAGNGGSYRSPSSRWTFRTVLVGGFGAGWKVASFDSPPVCPTYMSC